MLVQMFSTGTGKGTGPIDYVLSSTGVKFNKDGEIKRDERDNPITYDREPQPVVVAGEPELIRELIDSLDFKYKYTSGALSWAKEDGILSPEMEQEVIEDFEKTAFAGLDRDQYSILWVRQTHLGRHELHFVVPRVEHETGKSLNIAPPGYKNLFDPWRSLWNERENWASPDDPSRSRLRKGRGFEEKVKAANIRDGIEAAENPKDFITDFLVQRIEVGTIKNRSDIIESLEEAGLEINRQGKDYISIRTEPKAKPIRLKGLIYEERFNSIGFNGIDEREYSAGQVDYRKCEGGADEGIRETDEGRICSLQGELTEAISRRADYNKRYYKKREYRNSQGVEADDKDDPTTSLDNPEPLADYLRRKLGADSLDFTADFGELSGDAKPKPNLGGDGEKRQQGNFEPMWEQEGSLRESQDGRDFRWWLHDFTNKIRGIYDTTRTAVDGRIIKTIDSIRDGAEAATETNRIFDRASAGIDQASTDIGRCIEGVKVIMENRADELDRFKTRINLVEYAASQGYQLNRKESSNNSKTLEKDGDKIIVATSGDGHGVYFSVRDDADNGSIIDFIQKRQGLNLGQTRKALREFSGMSCTLVPELSKPRVTTKNIQNVIRNYLAMPEKAPIFLIKERKISQKIITDKRFLSKIRTTADGYAAFPHRNVDGVCGYEIKKPEYTGRTSDFSSGSSKGLWFSENANSADTIVFCESALDALSHAQAHENTDFGYVSFAGSPNKDQEQLIRLLMEKAAKRSVSVIFAVDNDEPGDKYIKLLSEVAEKTGISYSVDRPDGVNDWNDHIKKIANHEENRLTL